MAATDQGWGRSDPIGLAVPVEVEAGLKIGDLVVSARRPQHLDGSLLFGHGVVEPTGFCIRWTAGINRSHGPESVRRVLLGVLGPDRLGSGLHLLGLGVATSLP